MLNVATVFSGIGAFEHALMRMQIPYHIVFACDNGDVDIIKKPVITCAEDAQVFLNFLVKFLAQFNMNCIDENQDYLLDTTKMLEKAQDKLQQIYNNNKSSEKKYQKVLKDIIHDLVMLNERVHTIKTLTELQKISNYQEKKAYVDSLYSSKVSSNFVKKSYCANYDILDKHFHWNVSYLDGTQYNGQVDILVGGSPCQSFSLVGKQKGLADTRGTLFYEFARIIKEVNPKVFIYENVKALLNNDNGRTWTTIQEVFKSLGYVFKHDVLNSKDFGIPQNRERVFVVGIRNDIFNSEFVFPKPIKLNKTMKDFLLDNVSSKYYLPPKGVNFVTSEKNLNKRFTQINGDIQLCQKKNQQFNWHGDFLYVEENLDDSETTKKLEKYFLSEKVEKYVLSSGTKNFYSKPVIDLDIARPLLTTMHKMHRAGVDNYVTTHGKIRKLTPRECLRLMGFCDSFKIVVSDTQMYQQAGNSIVVDVLMAIIDSIKDAVPSLFD